jgi:major intracellular serine protease
MNTKNMVKVTAQILVVLAGCSLSAVCSADTLKIAVIDTGYDFKAKWPTNPDHPTPMLCKEGHTDLTTIKTSPNYLKDNHGHGTHIAGLIAKYAIKGYCLLIVKNYDPKTVSDNLVNTIKAFEYAISQDVDIINYSGGGQNKSEMECAVVRKALDKGIIIVAAAGNEGTKLKDNYYPALCDSRVIMVANVDTNNRTIASSSNLNKDTVSIDGTRVKSLLPSGEYGFMTGTSQATAIITGKLVQTLTIANIKRSNKSDTRRTAK